MLQKLLAVGALATLTLANPAAAETITISVTRSLATAPLFIAHERGFFKEEGLEAEFKYFNAAQPVAVAVASGDADIALTGLSAGLFNMAGKQSLRIIAGGTREQAGYSTGAFVVSNQAYQNGLKTVKDLSGKSFGLTQVGSPYHYILANVAEKYGFPLSTVKTLPLQTFGNIAAALKGNRIDAGLLNSYVALPLDKAGDAKIIAWIGDESPAQLTAVFTTVNTMQKRRDLVERFLRVYKKGSLVVAEAFQAGKKGDKAHEALRDKMLEELTPYTQVSTAQMLEGGFNYIDPQARIDVDDIKRQIETYKKLGLIDAGIESSSVLDLSFVSPLNEKAR